MIIEGVVGAQTKADGSVTQPRLGRLGELYTGECVGKYFELARRGQCYMASMQAAASLGTALTATAVTITLFNPLGSGVNGAILQCTVAGAGIPQTTTATFQNVVYAVNPVTTQIAPTGLTNAIVIPALLGGTGAAAQSNNLVKAYTACTLAAAPVIARVHPFGFANFTTNAVMAGSAAIDYVDGALTIAQGTACTLQGIATTTATSGLISIVWAEIPV